MIIDDESMDKIDDYIILKHRETNALYAIILAMLRITNIKLEYPPCTSSADVNELWPVVLSSSTVIAASRELRRNVNEEDVFNQLEIISQLWRLKDA